MNFYIAERDVETRKLIHSIIEKNFNDSILGVTSDIKQAYEDVMRLNIDIMFVDIDLDNGSGLDLVNQIHDSHHYPHFIMIANQLSDDQRTQAYQSDIDLVLNAPLNQAELASITHTVAENVRMSNRLLRILDLASGIANRHTVSFSSKTKRERKVNSILRYLGITAGVGAKDIRKIAKMMVEQHLNYEDIDINSAFDVDNAGKKVILQQIRRTLKKALVNIAQLSLQYPDDETVIEYANNLFGFNNVQNEILRMHGQRKTGGRIDVQYFFDGLIGETE